MRCILESDQPSRFATSVWFRPDSPRNRRSANRTRRRATAGGSPCMATMPSRSHQHDALPISRTSICYMSGSNVALLPAEEKPPGHPRPSDKSVQLAHLFQAALQAAAHLLELVL